MEINTKIIEVGEKEFAKSTGRPMWRLKTSDGNFNLFEETLAEEIRPFTNGMCNLEIINREDKDGKVWQNVKGIVKDSFSEKEVEYHKNKPIPTTSGEWSNGENQFKSAPKSQVRGITINEVTKGIHEAVETRVKSNNFPISMKVSYAKDIFVSSIQDAIKNGVIVNSDNVVKLMEQSCNLIKQAEKEFS